MMHATATATLIAVLAVLLTATLPAPAAAQSFFAESDALRTDSAVELTFSDLTDRSNTDSGGVMTFDDVDSSLHRLDARLRTGVLALGAMGEARRYTERTNLLTQRDDRDLAAGYGALALEELLTGDDSLLFVLSAGTRSEEFEYDVYLRELNADVKWQAGLVYRIAFFIAGIIRGEEELRLSVTDPVPTAIDETYHFNYDAWLAGLLFGDPQDLGLLLVVQRKDTPAVTGTTVDLEEGFEELKRAALSLGAVRLDYSEQRIREAFTGESLREATERDVSLGVQLSERFLVAASQKRSENLQEFTLLGVPISDTTETTENLIRIVFRF